LTIALGLDIGNATTEAVLAEVHNGRITVLGHDRLPTRGAKGSPASLDAGAVLIRRLERAHGVTVEEVAVAPLRPVSTQTVTLPEPAVDTGRLRLVRAGSETIGGEGFGVGAPYLLGRDPVPDGPVVAVVPAGLGYRDALPLLAKLSGLVAVVAERDEAVLLANRLSGGLPVVDEIPAHEVVHAALVAVEARGPGRPLTALSDPLRLTAALNLHDDGERADAARLAARLFDHSNAVVTLDAVARPASAPAADWAILEEAGRPVAYRLSGAGERRVDDLFTVDLAAIADAQLARTGSLASRTVVLAAMHRDAPPVDPSAALRDRLGVACRAVPSEAHAALHGGRSTPGAPGDALVVDLGGGTIDVVGDAGRGTPGAWSGGQDDHVATVAGAGELLTVATAAVLGSARTVAEYAKRGPAFRVDGPQMLVAEDGSRTFLPAPVAADVVGALVADGPAGWLAVHRGLAPAEWRALRLRLKAEVLGRNVSRALGSTVPAAVVVIGGPAGDDEAVGCVARVLPPGTAIGRGNVAGLLGHRYGVAYGLLVVSFTVGR
jgi:hypothetical protein